MKFEDLEKQYGKKSTIVEKPKEEVVEKSSLSTEEANIAAKAVKENTEATRVIEEARIRADIEKKFDSSNPVTEEMVQGQEVNPAENQEDGKESMKEFDNLIAEYESGVVEYLAAMQKARIDAGSVQRAAKEANPSISYDESNKIYFDKYNSDRDLIEARLLSIAEKVSRVGDEKYGKDRKSYSDTPFRDARYVVSLRQAEKGEKVIWDDPKTGSIRAM